MLIKRSSYKWNRELKKTIKPTHTTNITRAEPIIVIERNWIESPNLFYYIYMKKGKIMKSTGKLAARRIILF